MIDIYIINQDIKRFIQQSKNKAKKKKEEKRQPVFFLWGEIHYLKFYNIHL